MQAGDKEQDKHDNDKIKTCPEKAALRIRFYLKDENTPTNHETM